MRAGRRSKWASHVEPRLETIRMWRKMGFLEKEICERLGVGVSNFARYKLQYRELREALKAGKDDADAKVVDALYRRAVGYEYEVMETIAIRDAEGKLTGKIQLRKTKKHVTPNVLAQIYYLKNRCPQYWRDRTQHEHSGRDGQPLRPPVIHAYIPDNGRGVVRTGDTANRIAGTNFNHD